LILGKRADTKSLWNSEEKCKIEAIFDIKDYNLEYLFEKHELDYDHECIIRREISPSGKSRAFINDTPVTLDILNELGLSLIDIHSQHESLKLGKNQYQRYLLDKYASNQDLLEKYQIAYKKYRKTEKELKATKTENSKMQSDLDYKEFLLRELNEIKLEEIDQSELEDELNQLENAEEIKLKLGQIDQIAEHEEYGTSNQIKEISQILRSLKDFGHSYSDFYDRLESLSIEFQDLLQEVGRQNEKVHLDPARLNEVKDTLDTLNRLLLKHNADNTEELIKIRDNLQSEIERIGNLDQIIANLESEKQERWKETVSFGKELTKNRQAASANLSSELLTLIRQLGMENSSIIVEVTEKNEADEHGFNIVSILFSANKGIAPKELKEVASGGEFSRLIFAMKFLLAGKTAFPTLIFDEIDTGVSGEVALKMIRMMKKMSANHQIISISHLPQFAAGGDSHYFVYKDHNAEKSETRIQLLDAGKRIEAIAQMIGGENPSESAFSSAKELLELV
jgi:DNA repair protein RecN (Recombination protein N)